MRAILIALFIALGMASVTAELVVDDILLDTILCTIPDPSTGMTCSEFSNNPNEDIYYSVGAGNIGDTVLFAAAQQSPSTVRWNRTGTEFILKYNAKDVPRNKTGLFQLLNGPMNHAEALNYLRGPDYTDPLFFAEEETGEEIQNPNDPEFAIDDKYITP